MKAYSNRFKMAAILTFALYLPFSSTSSLQFTPVDFIYSACFQVNCKLGPASDRKAFGDFISELREVFDEHKLLLSAAVSPNRKVIDAGTFLAYWTKETYDLLNQIFFIRDRLWCSTSIRKVRLDLCHGLRLPRTMGRSYWSRSADVRTPRWHG